MRRIALCACLIVAIGLTILSGVLYGMYNLRWGPSGKLLQLAEKLSALPGDVGDWKLVDNEELPDSVTDMLQCAGYVNRNYKNGDSTVSVAILLGPHGPISVHTPEVCYSSREFLLTKRPSITLVESVNSMPTFWKTEFESKRLDGNVLRVYHAWTFDGRWEASKHPRISFIGRPYLYKIQLATVLPPGDEGQEDDACLEFLQEFIPALNKHVFASAS